MNRTNVKEQETNFLISESKKNPELFERETFIDSPDFLEKIGIFFGKNIDLPIGYLKLWPQDFIVEEIPNSGELQTIDSGDFFDKNKSFSEKDATIYTTLVKCKLPTFEVTREIANFLEIDSKKVKSAGIKDADAITSQLISIRGGDAGKLKDLSSLHYFLKNIYSGKGAIEVGSLQGNKFTILVRTDKTFEEKTFLNNLENLKKNGFYNFFYTQRFGTPRFINWFWGTLVLKGEYEKAVSSFLCSEGQREVPYFINIRNEIKKNLGSWNKILEILKPFPIIFQNETKIVAHLKDNPKDFIGALKQIADQVQLWVFAYGSLLFNRKISQYISKGEDVPEKFPLILSNDGKDWDLYDEFLQEDGIKFSSTKNLNPFYEVIQIKKRETKTMEKVQIHEVKIIPEGVVMSFSLSKGCYATTFLAQLFQLETGAPPASISYKELDTKEILGQKSIKDVVERFRKIIFPKIEDIFGKSE